MKEGRMMGRGGDKTPVGRGWMEGSEDRMKEGRAINRERWGQDPRWVGEGLNENGLVLFFDVWSGTPGTRMHMMALNANLTSGSTERNFSQTSGM